jgi:hypothetical protein
MVPALIELDNTNMTSSNEVANTVPAVGTVPKVEMNFKSTIPKKV